MGGRESNKWERRKREIIKERDKGDRGKKLKREDSKAPQSGVWGGGWGDEKEGGKASEYDHVLLGKAKK